MKQPHQDLRQRPVIKLLNISAANMIIHTEKDK